MRRYLGNSVSSSRNCLEKERNFFPRVSIRVLADTDFEQIISKFCHSNFRHSEKRATRQKQKNALFFHRNALNSDQVNSTRTKSKLTKLYAMIALQGHSAGDCSGIAVK